MSSIVRNICAVIAGLAINYIVDMSIILSSGFIVSPPPGADLQTAEGIRAAMPQMTFIHYLMPFLAHALGTLAGGFVAAVVAASHKMTFALVIGVLFLVQGIWMIALVGGPVWFIVADLGLAFLPMAWLGGKIGIALSGRNSSDFQQQPQSS